MTQPDALPADPFPDLAFVYDTPAVKAYRLEAGRYFTVDLDGVEISWQLENDEQAVTVASAIDHCIICTDPDCEICEVPLDTDRAESISQFGHPVVPKQRAEAAEAPAVAIPRQATGPTSPRRVWMAATVVGMSTAWLLRKGRRS